jgi:hypothetical protein
MEFFNKYVYDSIPIISGFVAVLGNFSFNFVTKNENAIKKISQKFEHLDDEEKKYVSLFTFTLEAGMYFLFSVILYIFTRHTVSFMLNVNDQSKSLIGYLVYTVLLSLKFTILHNFLNIIEYLNPRDLKKAILQTIGVCIFGILLFSIIYFITNRFQPNIPDMGNIIQNVKSSVVVHAEKFAAEMVVPLKIIAMQLVMTFVLWMIFFILDFVKNNHKFDAITDKKRKVFCGGVFIVTSFFMITTY